MGRMTFPGRAGPAILPGALGLMLGRRDLRGPRIVN
jgi:hypothetical protein